jgi:hypothetical protein
MMATLAFGTAAPVALVIAPESGELESCARIGLEMQKSKKKIQSATPSFAAVGFISTSSE